MSTSIRRRLVILETLKASRELQRLEDGRMEELVGRVQAMYPDEAKLWAAYERIRRLDSSEKKEDIEEYVEMMNQIIRELTRLQAEAAQPPK